MYTSVAMLAASLLSFLKAITAHTAQSLPDFSTLVWAWFYVWTSPAQALWELWRIRFEQCPSSDSGFKGKQYL